MRISISTTALVTALAASTAQAHEGNHTAGLAASLWHLLTQPDHWLGLSVVLALVAAGVIGRRLSTRKAIRSRITRSR